MILPGFSPRPCSYEVMAAAGCPRRRPTGLLQVNPGLEDGWCMGQAAAARKLRRSASFSIILSGKIALGFAVSLSVLV